jgi:hypothetical protein
MVSGSNRVNNRRGRGRKARFLHKFPEGDFIMGSKKDSDAEFKGKIFTFNTVGEVFEGRLVRIRNVKTKTGPARIANFDTGEGQFAIFLPAQLKRIIDEKLIGKRLVITYRGEVKDKKTGRMVKDFEAAVLGEK